MTDLPLALARARKRALHRYQGYLPPPHWCSEDWHAELFQIATLAVLEAELNYDSTSDIPLEVFAYKKAKSALWTFVRRELRWAKRLVSFHESNEPDEIGEPIDDTGMMEYQHTEQCLDLDCMLARLPEADRLLLLQIALGMSEREIAKREGLSQPGIHKRLQRIRKHIQEWWKDTF